MASRPHREARRLTSFCNITLIYLTILSIFAQIARANYSYSSQTLLDINIHCTNIGFTHQFDFNQLPPELIRTPGPSESLLPTGSARRRRRQRRQRKQRRGKRGGLCAKLRLNPHRPALPSVFLANVCSLPGKLDELKIWTLTQRWLRDCNLMFFMETWLRGDVADSVVELEGRALFRADRSTATTGKTRGGGTCIYIARANYSYSSQTLLDINIHCTNIGFTHQFDFNQLPPELIRTPGPSESLLPTGSARRRRRQRRQRKQRRGKRGGLCAKLRLNPHRPALPSVFLANVCSLPGKLDELKIWTLTQRWLRDCNLMFFMETWLRGDVADSVVELEGRALFRADRSTATTGKTRGGGTCIYAIPLPCGNSTELSLLHSFGDMERMSDSHPL
ncbi:hypothetical protein SRHO_G00152260 [Serrasalmus rhombeus]